MGMRTASPWWASLIFGLGLLFLLVGERLIGADAPSIHYVLSGGGVGMLIAVTLARVWTTVSTQGARRKVERAFVVCHVGTLAGLAFYTLTTGWGPKWSDGSHAPTMLMVVFVVLVIASIMPVLMIELSLGTALRTNFDVHATGADQLEGVELYRVRELGWSGLSIGLALCLLMVTCQVANERNVSRDVSYFKTSSPGESTIKIVETSSDPIKVLLFFPETNEVKDQVHGYFEALHAATSKIEIEDHDRMADAELAALHKVTKDGIIVLTRGTGDKLKTQQIDVDTDLEKARRTTGKLRNLDREVNATLMKLVRDKRKIYLTAGHGEINDPGSMPAEAKARLPGERKTTAFRKRFADLQYEVKDLGVVDLGRDVPEDAAAVMVLAPTVPLLDAEWDALSRYLDRGGRVLIALDPLANGALGPLEGKLGVKFNAGHLTDDQKYIPQRGTKTDRRYVVTTQFSAHASTTGLSRSIDKGLVLIDSGALEDAPFTTKGEQPKKTYTIKSLESSYLDFNDNNEYDPTGVVPEKKQRWNIAAAIEGPKQPQDKDGFRALVLADVDLFVDVYARDLRGFVPVMISGPLLDDGVKWLVGDEAIVGEVVSEDDKPIQHTKGQDAAWFTLTIVGMPLVVLGAGLFGTWARKKRRTRRSSEVKS